MSVILRTFVDVGFGQREMLHVDHACAACDQVTRVPLKRLRAEAAQLEVVVPLTRAKLRNEFAYELELRGIGHNNGGLTYMVDIVRAGTHRMVRCGGCLAVWSLTDALEGGAL